MTIREALNQAESILLKLYLGDENLTGVPGEERQRSNARLDSQILLGHLLKVSEEELLIHDDKPLEIHQYKTYQDLLERRLKHEPIAQIIGEKEFYGLRYKINKHVLIPRPETEMLVEQAIFETKHLEKKFGPHDYVIADIGTGSGNIIISIAKNLATHASHKKENLPHFYGVDVDEETLNLAQQNAELNDVSNHIYFVLGNLIQPIGKHIDLLLANLPYLPKSDYLNSPLDVRLYEPELALVGGDDGLDLYRELLDQVKRHYSPHQDPDHTSMTLLFEIDPSQPRALESALKERFEKYKLETKKDLSGRDRLAIIRL